LKFEFASEEMTSSSEKYSKLGAAHKDIFKGQSGMVTELRELNIKTHKAMEELLATLNGKSVDLT